jgi:hypothetical protein
MDRGHLNPTDVGRLQTRNSEDAFLEGATQAEIDLMLDEFDPIRGSRSPNVSSIIDRAKSTMFKMLWRGENTNS